MASIILKAWKGYKYVFEDLTDPRTRDLPLVAKPYQWLTVIALYFMFIFKWGPSFMKNRPAYDLKKIILVYNAFQVVACAFVFIKALQLGWWRDYRWICEPVDFSYSEKAITISRTVYFYYLLKIVDLLDTIFFILRKRNKQVSFLHVYHHFGMVGLVWAAVTYYPGGHGTLIGVINCFVHVVMYTYYLITVWDPSLKANLWWKKHITQLQIIQFLWCVIHMAALVFKTDCEYPRWTAAVFLPQNLFMLILFLDFYINEYIKKPRELKKNEELKLATHNGKEELDNVLNGKNTSRLKTE